MKSLRIITLSLMAIIFSMMAYGDFSYDLDRDRDEWRAFRECTQDIRVRALRLMDMLDKTKNKAKIKTLSIMLEAELDMLQAELNRRIEFCQNRISNIKQRFYSNNNTSQDSIEDFLEYMEREEKTIRFLESALYLAKQWKRDYCY